METYKPTYTSGEPFVVGGFVKDPEKGKFNWVVTVDAASLYPTVIVSGNISPDKKVLNIPKEFKPYLALFSDNEDEGFFKVTNTQWEEIDALLVKYNMSLSALGVLYYNDEQGLLSKIVEEIYYSRKADKKTAGAHKKKAEELKMQGAPEEEVNKELELYTIFHLRELAKKISINSYYGATGNEYFQLYDIDLAASVTANGRCLNKSVAYAINSFLQKLSPTFAKKNFFLYADTDSIFINLDPIVSAFAKTKNITDLKELAIFTDKFVETHIRPVMDNAIADFAKKLNLFKHQILFYDREKICNVMLLLGKKTYICDVIDNEGTLYNTPKRTMKGVTLIRTSTAKFVRENVPKMLDTFMYKTNDAFYDEYAALKKKFYSSSFLDMAKLSTVNSLDYSLETGRATNAVNGKYNPIPISSRAALVYNMLIEKLNLQQYHKIAEAGDKIRIIYLKTPNIYRQNVVGFINEQFIVDAKLEKLIDYEENWDKNVAPNIYNICESIDWKTEKIESVFDF